MLADEHGLPLSVVLSGANTHDVKLLEDTLEHIVVAGTRERTPTESMLGCRPQSARAARKRRNWNAILISMPAAGALVSPAYFFNRFRKLLVRYEKKAANYLALIQFACEIG